MIKPPRYGWGGCYVSFRKKRRWNFCFVFFNEKPLREGFNSSAIVQLVRQLYKAIHWRKFFCNSGKIKANEGFPPKLLNLLSLQRSMLKPSLSISFRYTVICSQLSLKFYIRATSFPAWGHCCPLGPLPSLVWAAPSQWTWTAWSPRISSLPDLSWDPLSCLRLDLDHQSSGETIWNTRRQPWKSFIVSEKLENSFIFLRGNLC